MLFFVLQSGSNQAGQIKRERSKRKLKKRSSMNTFARQNFHKKIHIWKQISDKSVHIVMKKQKSDKTATCEMVVNMQIACVA